LAKPIEAALLNIPNRFLLTTVLARRWENLVAGAPPLVESRTGRSLVEIAIHEIAEGRVAVDEETRTVQLSGQPQVEENEEALFSAAIEPGDDSLEQLIPRKGQ
jgi:DNA-directed RNA polymerase subunit K/omega